MCYKLGLEIVLEIIHCIFLFQVIYIYILFDYIPLSHYSFVFATCGLRYSIHSDFVSLRRYHFLPLFLIAFETLGTMFNLVGGGELRKEVLLSILSYFGILVNFCLNFKIF